MTPPHLPRNKISFRLFICLTSFSMLPLACKKPPGTEEGYACAEGLVEGALVISEIMPDPKGQDSGKEWLEIYNASDTTIHLKGVALAVSKLDGSSEQGHRIEQDIELAPGAYFVLGSVSQEESPDLYPSHIHYAYGTDISLNNTQGRLQLLCGASEAQTLLDEARYDYETKADIKEGYAWNLDSNQGLPDAAVNDDNSYWCAASNAYSAEEYGTPGAANSACPLPLPPGQQCYDGNNLREVSLPQIGELVINEFLANPAGTDGDKEWLELKINAGRDLNGLLLGKLKDGVPDLVSAQTISAPQCLQQSADSYVVFAASEDVSVNGGLSEIDFPLEFTLSNSGSGLFVALPGATADDMVLLDQIEYSSVPDGAATSLDPRFATAENNDNPDYFCPATTPYGDESNLGTPGAMNLECQDIHPEGQCFENGAWRDIIAPAIGDLVITEYMPDPSKVGDTEGEWFEVHARKKVDLNGLEIGKAGTVPETLNATECMSVHANQYIVFARKLDNNGGLLHVDYTVKLSLSNSNSDFFIGRNGEVLDQVFYTTTIESGVARKLKAEVLLDENAPIVNDEEAQWCNAPVSEAYGDGDLGSPGSTNSEECGGDEPPPPDKTTCIDPDTNMKRDIQFPSVGQVILTEFMANPEKVEDKLGEWFEIYVPESIDLNYLQFGNKFANGGEFTLTPQSDECIEVAGGSYIVLAKNKDPMMNGGLEAVDYEFSGFDLYNSGDNMGIFVSVKGNLLDQITYSTPSKDISTSLSKTKTSPLENDILENWCLTPPEYVYVDNVRGTPGAENPECPEQLPPGTCSENGQPRPIKYPPSDSIRINEFMADPETAEDAQGEWLEIYNPSMDSVDLNGLQIGTVKGGVYTTKVTLPASGDCIVLPINDYFVLAKSANSNSPIDTDYNGGIATIDFIAPSLSITNLNNGLFLRNSTDPNTILDEISYASVELGRSYALDPDNNPEQWCDCPVDASYQYGEDMKGYDYGTPGGVNPQCP